MTPLIYTCGAVVVVLAGYFFGFTAGVFAALAFFLGKMVEASEMADDWIKDFERKRTHQERES